jgi:hypothetical protein
MISNSSAIHPSADARAAASPTPAPVDAAAAIMDHK